MRGLLLLLCACGGVEWADVGDEPPPPPPGYTLDLFAASYCGEVRCLRGETQAPAEWPGQRGLGCVCVESLECMRTTTPPPWVPRTVEKGCGDRWPTWRR